MENEKQVIAYLLETPDGTILQSKFRYDYVTYTDKNGKEYMIDGGNDYCRTSTYDRNIKTIYTDSPFEEIREYFYWGKNFDENNQRLPKTEYIRLKDLKSSHIDAILSWFEDRNRDLGWRKDIFKAELTFRQQSSL